MEKALPAPLSSLSTDGGLVALKGPGLVGTRRKQLTHLEHGVPGPVSPSAFTLWVWDLSSFPFYR